MTLILLILTIISLCPSLMFLETKQTANFGILNFNLYIYYDEVLLNKFNNDINQLERFIMAITNSVALMYNNYPLNQLGKFNFIINNIEKVDPNVRINDESDGGIYHNDFTYLYIPRLQYLRYTVAILLTGHNFRFKSNQTDTQGLAYVGTACKRRANNFILIEARSYKAAYIMAHEIGHTLNMQHDENGNQLGASCESNKVMSATTGEGKTKFSMCSYYMLRDYLSTINEDTLKCFSIVPPKYLAMYPQAISDERIHISTDEQCKITLGSSFRTADKYRHSVCAKITCTNEIFDIFIDPAIENTTCAVGKYCRAGECI